ncbi:hypothetical protein B9Z19DRAFT_1094111 [Tuber borchii]|uniref:Uncharacterized protein n=1 Tax=Tuber borchii TaxID=42251 RepID=A0A2T6ZEN3_TUBBO|nr:hypothetical protein B9Z19DRAFT_1094111 [Tuber borchii]
MARYCAHAYTTTRQELPLAFVLWLLRSRKGWRGPHHTVMVYRLPVGCQNWSAGMPWIVEYHHHHHKVS